MTAENPLWKKWKNNCYCYWDWPVRFSFNSIGREALSDKLDVPLVDA